MCACSTNLGAEAEPSVSRAVGFTSVSGQIRDSNKKREACVYIFLQGQFIQEVFLDIRADLGGA